MRVLVCIPGTLSNRDAELTRVSRTPWQGDDLSVQRIKDLKARGRVNEEGYVNVATELGLSGTRGKEGHPLK